MRGNYLTVTTISGYTDRRLINGGENDSASIARPHGSQTHTHTQDWKRHGKLNIWGSEPEQLYCILYKWPSCNCNYCHRHLFHRQFSHHHYLNLLSTDHPTLRSLLQLWPCKDKSVKGVCSHVRVHGRWWTMYSGQCQHFSLHEWYLAWLSDIKLIN